MKEEKAMLEIMTRGTTSGVGPLKMRGNGGNTVLVLFSFLLDIANLLRDLLKTVLVVRVLCLKLCSLDISTNPLQANHRLKIPCCRLADNCCCDIAPLEHARPVRSSAVELVMPESWSTKLVNVTADGPAG